MKASGLKCLFQLSGRKIFFLYTGLRFDSLQYGDYVVIIACHEIEWVHFPILIMWRLYVILWDSM